MSRYVVPQDVEADDKLLGPFSFRQFVYLLIVAGFIAVAWGLSNIFIGLALIPVPFIIFFGALALPLRKEQPVETYLAALVSFWTKPKIRLWDPEGIENTIEIKAPKILQQNLTKNIYGEEAIQQLGYLSNVLDTGGWSAVNPSAMPLKQNTQIIADVVAEADTAPDMFGNYDMRLQNISRMIDKNTNMTKEQLLQKFQQEVSVSLKQEPQKISTIPTSTAPNTERPVQTPVNPAIISLANDDTLNVDTIAKQANRIVKQSADEVFVSLR